MATRAGMTDVFLRLFILCCSQYHLRALPAEYGRWNSVWKRCWRLSQTGFFEAFFEALAVNSETAHLVVIFDSTVVRLHVSAAGAKGGKKTRRLDDHAAVSQLKFMS